jgi:hypothetical protein
MASLIALRKAASISGVEGAILSDRLYFLRSAASSVSVRNKEEGIARLREVAGVRASRDEQI